MTTPGPIAWTLSAPRAAILFSSIQEAENVAGEVPMSVTLFFAALPSSG